MSDKINTFRNYNDLTKAEQEQVDSMLESYKNDTLGPQKFNIRYIDDDNPNTSDNIKVIEYDKKVTSNDIDNFMSKITGRIAQVNEKLKDNVTKNVTKSDRVDFFGQSSTSSKSYDSEYRILYNKMIEIQSDILEIKKCLNAILSNMNHL